MDVPNGLAKVVSTREKTRASNVNYVVVLYDLLVRVLVAHLAFGDEDLLQRHDPLEKRRVTQSSS